MPEAPNTPTKGNNPERWQKLLDVLDEKLQLGLLDHLRKVAAYHFEENILIIQPQTEDSREYLTKDTVLKQLELFAQDATGVEKIKIEAAPN
jgi:hypothetical protein